MIKPYESQVQVQVKLKEADYKLNEPLPLPIEKVMDLKFDIKASLESIVEGLENMDETVVASEIMDLLVTYDDGELKIEGPVLEKLMHLANQSLDLFAQLNMQSQEYRSILDELNMHQNLAVNVNESIEK